MQVVVAFECNSCCSFVVYLMKVSTHTHITVCHMLYVACRLWAAKVAHSHTQQASFHLMALFAETELSVLPPSNGRAALLTSKATQHNHCSNFPAANKPQTSPTKWPRNCQQQRAEGRARWVSLDWVGNQLKLIHIYICVYICEFMIQPSIRFHTDSLLKQRKQLLNLLLRIRKVKRFSKSIVDTVAKVFF